MRHLLIVAGVVVLGLAIRVCQQRRAHRAARLIDQAIDANRYRYVAGMRRMDEGLRDRTAARRRDREEALQAIRRELPIEQPRRRLSRAV